MTKKFRKAISNASLTTSIAKQDVSLFPPQVTMALKKVVTTALNISKTKVSTFPYFEIQAALFFGENWLFLPDSEDGLCFGQVLQQVPTMPIPHFHVKGLLEATSKPTLACDRQALSRVIMNVAIFRCVRGTCNKKISCRHSQ